jgi:hypothetical protein
MPFEEYQFLRYFIPGSLFVIYTSLIIYPALNADTLTFLESKPEIVLGIVGGAFAGSLAFGYLVYTFYDTVLYNLIAMNSKWRILLRYLAAKIPEWNNLKNHEKKMIMEMIHTSGDYTRGVDKFYDIVRGWWSHFNARIVCALFVPALSLATFGLLLLLDFFFLKTIEIFSFNNQYTASYTLIFITIFAISLCLFIGAIRPLREATQYEYYFIKKQNRGQ